MTSRAGPTPGAESSRVLAFDVGGTHVRGALCDGRGALLRRTHTSTPRGDGDALLDALVEMAGQLGSECGPGPRAVGLALAGLLDLPRGRLALSPNLELTDVDVTGPLERRLNLPVALVNDVNAAALGEAWAADCDHLVALFLGTGVGLGAVAGGRLIEGQRGMAGEAGHLIYDESGPVCPAGCRGCFDAVLGGQGLARAAAAQGIAEDTKGLLAAYRAGEQAAGELVRRALDAMTVLTRLAVNMFDPQRIVVGGGLASHLPELMRAARLGVTDNPMGFGRTGLAVLAAQLGDDAGLVGAARRALMAGAPESR